MTTTVKRLDSQDTNVSKYVFDFGSAVAESVLYRYPTYQERTVVCCSTQSGCPVGCRFCGTGENFVRSLTADEIVFQVQHLFADRGVDAVNCDKLQIMFMSMGEPMLNYRHLESAIRQLHALYPNAALLISTSGPKVDYKPLRSLSSEISKVGLQFSVHESTDAARDILVPFKAKLTLREIAHEGEEWYRATGRQPFFNYCAVERNSTQEDADRLAALLDPAVWQATVSVVCESTESVAAANIRQRELATGFMSLLLGKGYSVRCFDPAGQDDIGGGCGQLWYVQDWMKRNPGLTRHSAGFGHDKVHTPGIQLEKTV